MDAAHKIRTFRWLIVYTLDALSDPNGPAAVRHKIFLIESMTLYVNSLKELGGDLEFLKEPEFQKDAKINHG